LHVVKSEQNIFNHVQVTFNRNDFCPRFQL